MYKDMLWISKNFYEYIWITWLRIAGVNVRFRATVIAAALIWLSVRVGCTGSLGMWLSAPNVPVMSAHNACNRLNLCPAGPAMVISAARNMLYTTRISAAKPFVTYAADIDCHCCNHRRHGAWVPVRVRYLVMSGLPLCRSVESSSLSSEPWPWLAGGHPLLEIFQDMGRTVANPRLPGRVWGHWHSIVAPNGLGPFYCGH